MISCKHCGKQLSPKTKIHDCKVAGKLPVEKDSDFIEGEFPDQENLKKPGLFGFLFSGDGTHSDWDWTDGDGDSDGDGDD